MRFASRLSTALAFVISVFSVGVARSEFALPWTDAKVESLASLDNPWSMAFLPDGHMLISEKPGNLRHS